MSIDYIQGDAYGILLATTDNNGNRRSDYIDVEELVRLLVRRDSETELNEEPRKLPIVIEE